MSTMKAIQKILIISHYNSKDQNTKFYNKCFSNFCCIYYEFQKNWDLNYEKLNNMCKNGASGPRAGRVQSVFVRVPL